MGKLLKTAGDTAQVGEVIGCIVAAGEAAPAAKAVAPAAVADIAPVLAWGRATVAARHPQADARRRAAAG